MKLRISISRHFLAAVLLVSSAFPLAAQDDAASLVFRSGRSIPLSAVAQQGENFVVRQAVSGYQAGAIIPANAISHISGEKPKALSVGTSQLLMGQAREAIKTLEPLVASLKPTSRISGNYWIDAARALVLAYAQEKESAKMDPLVKEISDATPAPGTDPAGRLAKALATPVSSGFETRISALEDQISDSNPTEISAFASYFKGRLLEEQKKNTNALQAYLTVGCLYPSGAILVTSAAEFQAGLLLAAKNNRRDEAIALIKSAMTGSSGTTIAEEATKRLESLADVTDQPKEETKESSTPAK